MKYALLYLVRNIKRDLIHLSEYVFISTCQNILYLLIERPTKLLLCYQPITERLKFQFLLKLRQFLSDVLHVVEDNAHLQVHSTYQ